MKVFNIDGKSYLLMSSSDEPCDYYGFKGKITTIKPKNAKLAGYIELDDGTTVECYTPKNTLAILLVVIILAILAIVGGIVYFAFMYKGDDNPLGTFVETKVDQNIVYYNGYMQASNGSLNVDFTNGEIPSVIIVTGKGIETKATNLAPNQHIDNIPIKVTSMDGAIEATLHIKSEATQVEYPVVIENTDANNANDIIDSEAGYWDKEEVMFPIEHLPEQD